MRCTSLRSFVLCALSAATLVATTTTTTTTTGPTRTRLGRNDDGGFVTAVGTQLTLDGKEFKYVGTNAYWLGTVFNEDDIKTTLRDIAKRGIKVVRTWAFNDVTEIPQDGSVWFQLIKDGHQTLNEGANGLQRLDKIAQFAEEEGLKLVLSLTNNWNPVGGEVPGRGKDGLRKRHNDDRPRNFLSNDYGGMDAYVREFGCDGTHDEFYTNRTIVDKFKWYTGAIVNRFKDSKTLLAWEIANDARCASSLPASAACDTLVVTDWVHELAGFVRSLDENHLVSSGVHGFLCPDCPKRFPPPPTPPPTVSPLPKPNGNDHKDRRAPGPKPVTRENLTRRFIELRKAKRERRRRELGLGLGLGLASGRGRAASGVSIRGRWVAELDARDSDGALGPAFDGTFGVDSQDILSSPNIDIGSFQLFPDQNAYIPCDYDKDDFSAALEIGREWASIQGDVGAQVGKPTSLNAFGIVTEANLPFFVPFNSTEVAVRTDLKKRQSAGISNTQQQTTFITWATAAFGSGAAGASHYQWSQAGNTAGNTITTGTGTSTTAPGGGGVSGYSPNDGYASQPIAPDAAAGVA